jgi:hypothetical protein
MDGITGEMLFYGGLAGAGLILVVAVIAGIALGLSGARLRARLETEYGKRPR